MVFQSGGGLFALFGLVFIAIAIMQAVYHLKNATGENRYSAFDLVDGQEESNPLHQRFGRKNMFSAERPEGKKAASFCPYCGAGAGQDFVFCKKCGKKLV